MGNSRQVSQAREDRASYLISSKDSRKQGKRSFAAGKKKSSKKKKTGRRGRNK